MSHKPYYKKAQAKQIEEGENKTPEVNRFSDTREINKRRHEILDYLVIGYDPEEIADFMDLELYTVENDVKAIIEKGYEAREEDVKEVRDEIMRTYRLVKKEGYKAFRLSQGEVEKTTVEEGTGGKNGNFTKEKIVTQIQSGDPRYLSVMIDAAKEMGKVSGAQKHKEVEIQNNMNQQSVTILSPNRTEMPDEFDRWTKKPEGEEMPDANDYNLEDM